MTDSFVRRLHEEMEKQFFQRKRWDLNRLANAITAMFNEVSRYDFNLQQLQPASDEDSVAMMTWII